MHFVWSLLLEKMYNRNCRSCKVYVNFWLQLYVHLRNLLVHLLAHLLKVNTFFKIVGLQKAQNYILKSIFNETWWGNMLFRCLLKHWSVLIHLSWRFGLNWSILKDYFKYVLMHFLKLENVGCIDFQWMNKNYERIFKNILMNKVL